MSQAKEISAQLRALASPDTASILQGFFKTGPGQYGEGDVFLGIKIPPLRALAKQHRDADLPTIESLLASKYHEQRMFALLLLMQFYQAADETGRQAAYDLYLSNTARINNWDLVDVSAPHIVGHHLEQRPRAILRQLAQSDSLWERRIAIIATFHFIRQNDFADTIRIAEMLLDDKHDLMHKAVGWMLREVGKRDQKLAERFLQQHYPRLPRTALRYAIERFDPPLRKQYLKRTFSIA
ncbi:MAG: DNA alkylation repair protein [Gammaproteobacteria bacterium]|nr:DNA alkylation repair protein [Gammaproteobacteria bacterium]MBU1625591.1 DNA alkylation repair protein [Gammaproteobacteria bacterium]MBU1980851.1 DNA alkylation repair protein [Gammaproteobacteria bacterium]